MSYLIWLSILITAAFYHLSILCSQHGLHLSCHKTIFSSFYSLFPSMTMNLPLLLSILNSLISANRYFLPLSILIFSNHFKFTVKRTHLENIELRTCIFAAGISILNHLRKITILYLLFSTNHNFKLNIKNACLIIENFKWKCFLKNIEPRMENYIDIPIS